MAKLIAIILSALLINVVVSQDFEPSPLEPPKVTTTTTTTTTTTEAPITTTESINDFSAITDLSTDSPFSTSLAPLTTTTTEEQTTSPQSSTRPTTMRTTMPTTMPTTTMPESIPTTTWPTIIDEDDHPGYPDYRPSYPSFDDAWNRQCYHREQYGMPYLKWVCGTFKYIYPVECYYCCRYDFYSFAGCNRVHHSYCHEDYSD